MPLISPTGYSPPVDPLVSSSITPSNNLIIERILLTLEGVGSDVIVERRLNHINLRRRNTFAAIKENPRGGVMLGLFLPGTLVGGRLLDGMGFRMARVTHQVLLREGSEVDEELRRWLKQAYRRG